MHARIFPNYLRAIKKPTDGPGAKVIADNYLNKLLAMDGQFAGVKKEKTKLELANQEFEDTVGVAMDRKLKKYVLKKDKNKVTVILKTKSANNNSLIGLDIVSNGNSSNHLSDLLKTPKNLSAA